MTCYLVDTSLLRHRFRPEAVHSLRNDALWANIRAACKFRDPLRNRLFHGRSPRAIFSSNLPMTSTSSMLSVSASIFLTALLT